MKDLNVDGYVYGLFAVLIIAQIFTFQ